MQQSSFYMRIFVNMLIVYLLILFVKIVGTIYMLYYKI